MRSGGIDAGGRVDTATPSSPMTNPVFAPAAALDLGLAIAAQTFGPTCFSVNGGSAASWVLVAQDTQRRNAGQAKVKELRSSCSSSLEGRVSRSVRTKRQCAEPASFHPGSSFAAG